MTILVTGANGQLGNEMRSVSAGCAERYIFADVNQAGGVGTMYLDITDIDSVRKAVAENEVDVIVNCAAYTDVDAAESDEAAAERLNAEAPGNLAAVMKEAGGLLVHISTDYVFGDGGFNIPYREDHDPAPSSVYGRTKLQGERNVAASGCDHVIIRTSWLYSGHGRNFCKTMMRLTAERPQVKVVFDQVGTPTYARDLAKAVAVVLEDYSCRCREHGGYVHSGIYHYSNEGVCSWYDFAMRISEFCGTTGCEILPCHSGEYPSPVKRPAYSVLDKTKIKEAFGISIPYWADSLKECISALK